MEGSTYTLTLTQPELNLVWSALQGCTIKGADAVYLVGLMAKVQNAAKPPVPEEDAGEE